MSMSDNCGLTIFIIQNWSNGSTDTQHGDVEPTYTLDVFYRSGNQLASEMDGARHAAW